MTDRQATLCFVDVETTSLDAETGEIWEVGIILREHDDLGGYTEVEHRWLLPVTLKHADPISLSIGGFHERHPQGNTHVHLEHELLDDLWDFAREFAQLTHGAHLVGAVVSFDEKRLERILRSQNVMPSWHYHVVDVEALAVGYLAATSRPLAIRPPWNSRELTGEMGVAMPLDEERHTALGDARWAARLYDAVVGAER